MRVSPIIVLTVLLIASVVRSRADIDSNIIAHFPLNETGGTLVSDIVTGSQGTLNANPSPTWANPGLRFSGQSFDQANLPAPASSLTNEMTIAFWVQPERHRDRDTIVFSSSPVSINSYPFLIQLGDTGNLKLTNMHVNGHVINRGDWTTQGTVPLNTWTHVAITYDGSTLKFYFDGVLEANPPGASLAFNPISSQTMGGLPGGNYYNGSVLDYRLYSRALTQSDINQFFSARVDPSLAGLWIGEATLDEVKAVQTSEWASAPTKFSHRVIVHVDALGQIRLLDEAALMHTKDVPAQPIVLTDISQASEYDGIVRRGGKRVGQRFSCSSISFSSSSVPLAESNGWLEASINLGANHPLNPFRHKYHPDLASAWSIDRTIRIQLNDSGSPSGDEISGTLWETVDGIHKDAIEARGPIAFTRVSTAAQLR